MTYTIPQSWQSPKLFLLSSELGLPQPLTRRRGCPPPPTRFWGEGHTRWRERCWESPNSDEGTYTVVLFTYKCFVPNTHQNDPCTTHQLGNIVKRFRSICWDSRTSFWLAHTGHFWAQAFQELYIYLLCSAPPPPPTPDLMPKQNIQHHAPPLPLSHINKLCTNMNFSQSWCSLFYPHRYFTQTKMEC